MNYDIKTMRLLVGIMVSFIFASVVNIYPLEHVYVSIRPMSLVMMLIFWLIYAPGYVGAIIAFFVGLSSDLLLDTHLGHQAFCAVSVAFALRVFGIYFKQPTFLNAWLQAVVGLTLFQALLWILQAFASKDFAWVGVSALMTSIVLWVPFWWVMSRLFRLTGR